MHHWNEGVFHTSSPNTCEGFDVIFFRIKKRTSIHRRIRQNSGQNS